MGKRRNNSVNSEIKHRELPLGIELLNNYKNPQQKFKFSLNGSFAILIKSIARKPIFYIQGPYGYGIKTLYVYLQLE